MTHASPTEIHDHVFGFRLSEHIAGCTECGRSADAVAAERETLRDVLEEEPVSAPPELLQRLAVVEPQRRRIGSVALAAAALLLAALSWVLFQPKSAVDSSGPASPPPTQEAEIERLIGELKRSKERSEIAWVALRAYGGAAVEPLIKARAPSALIDECRGIPIADQIVIRKLKEKGVTVELTNVPLTAAVDYLREISGENFHISGVENPDGIMVTLKRRTGSVYEHLEALSAITNIPFAVKDGIVLFGKKPPATGSWAPLRFPPRIEAARELEAALKGGKPHEQEKAVEGLRKLGFSAEPVLWDLLDSPDLAVQSQAAHLLRTLYLRGVAPGLMTPFARRTAEVYRILDTWKGDVDFINASALDLLADLSKRSGVSILIDPQVDFENKPITFRSKDLVLKNNLKLLLSQFQLDYVAVDGWVVVSKPGRMELSNPVPIWLPAQEVQAAQKLLQDAVSPETTKIPRPKLMEVGRPALAWLGAGADAALPADAARYRALQQDLAESLNVWIVDRPSGIELQTLTDAQKAILAHPVAEGQIGLENLPLVVKSPKEVRVVCSTAPGLKLGSFLKAVTRIQGLDYFMTGDQIVIDTAANVRKVVEK